ncbi:hypothetical protein PPL_09451 [Heterostelium album PN500]|uniref:PDEase domain-containing protein n=1 Tax=Heterostelium pallidum (strain ATCC 26659 / Pp 5 / PN500) TaxID=670386 RepID=D3BPI2_HETP5|nr:hypothetical protein PPL_09451 [Heterostelium album PN500]EFA76700.1 hypothetical protein PPL_09451 [Heterostelium album PN500]|eukprot:XP_020428832.1 hypothetical protein PPL_09451 [Heterostelium album PN500]
MKTAIQTSPSLNSYITQHEDIRPLAFSLNSSTNSTSSQQQIPNSQQNNKPKSTSRKLEKTPTEPNKHSISSTLKLKSSKISLNQNSPPIKNLIINKETKFLIIDFDNKSRELLEIWLRTEGFNVFSSKNVVDSLSLLENNSYDLVIYDTDSKIENIETLTNSQIFYIVNKMEFSQFQQKSNNKLEFQSKPVSKGNLLSHITYVLENRLKSYKLKEYEQLVKEKEEEIETLKSKVGQLKLDNAKIHKAMEPPIEAITNSLNEILMDTSLSNSPIKRELENILYQITTNTDLYGPAVEKLMNQDINPIAKSILKTYSASNISDSVSPAIRSKVVETEVIDIEPLKVWGFNPYLYTHEQLIGMLHRIFTYYQLPEKLRIPEFKLNHFLYQVRSIQIAITCIISTDMSLHFPLVTRLKQRLTELKLNNLKSLDNSLQDRIFLMEIMLHAADISNVSKPWDVSKIWCHRINVESFVQGRMEHLKGIPVTDWMDETKTSVEKNSLNFMVYLGSAFYELISEMFPQTRICFEYLKNNVEGWTKVCEDNKHLPHSKTMNNNIDNYKHVNAMGTIYNVNNINNNSNNNDNNNNNEKLIRNK